eukprot:2894673-Rhodomonas_salina.1
MPAMAMRGQTEHGHQRREGAEEQPSHQHACRTSPNIPDVRAAPMLAHGTEARKESCGCGEYPRRWRLGGPSVQCCRAARRICREDARE